MISEAYAQHIGVRAQANKQCSTYAQFPGSTFMSETAAAILSLPPTRCMMFRRITKESTATMHVF